MAQQQMEQQQAAQKERGPNSNEMEAGVQRYVQRNNRNNMDQAQQEQGLQLMRYK